MQELLDLLEATKEEVRSLAHEVESEKISSNTAAEELSQVCTVGNNHINACICVGLIWQLQAFTTTLMRGPANFLDFITKANP